MTDDSSLKLPSFTLSLKKALEERILKILQSETRTEDDCILLFSRLKKINFFETYLSDEDGEVNREACVHCLKRIKYEKYDPGDVVVKQGDESNGRAYIIYSGEVSVIVQDYDIITKQNIKRKETLKQQKEDGQISEEDDSDTSTPKKSPKEDSINKWLFGKQKTKLSEK
jgi:hypothetical protein